MKTHTILIIFSALISGCGDESTKTTNTSAVLDSDPAQSELTTSQDETVPPEIADATKELANRQSEGLNAAKVIIHKAYEYDGETWIKPSEFAKLIAVDVEFRNYTQDFDLDDVDILDGKSNENYGSYPDIFTLTQNGKLASPEIGDSAPSNENNSLRVLLIYAVPKELNSVKLRYWGKELTPEMTMLLEKE